MLNNLNEHVETYGMFLHRDWEAWPLSKGEEAYQTTSKEGEENSTDQRTVASLIKTVVLANEQFGQLDVLRVFTQKQIGDSSLVVGVVARKPELSNPSKFENVQTVAIFHLFNVAQSSTYPRQGQG